MKFSFTFLKHPITTGVSIALGIAAGILFKDFSLSLAPIGAIYLKLLQMTIIPILMTALITSIGKLFLSAGARRYAVKVAAVSLVCLLAVSVFAMGAALVVAPGSGLSKAAQVVLGRTLSAADEAGGAVPAGAAGTGVFDFLQKLIPLNVFDAMGRGASLELLFFSLVFGVAAGLLKKEQATTVFNLTEALYRALFVIVGWIMHLLPFGLFALLASQIAATGAETLSAMLRFVILVWGVSLAVMAGSLLIVCLRSRRNPLAVLASLKETVMIGFGTQSTFASMPALIDGLTGPRLGFSPGIVNLVVPVGAVVNRFSMIIVYATATVFASQLYGIDLGAGGLLLAVLLCILAGVAGSGSPGIVSLSLVSIVFGPVGLPAAPIVVLLLAVNPVVEPITTAANVLANSAVASLIAPRETEAAGTETVALPAEGGDA